MVISRCGGLAADCSGGYGDCREGRCRRMKSARDLIAGLLSFSRSAMSASTASAGNCARAVIRASAATLLTKGDLSRAAFLISSTAGRVFGISRVASFGTRRRMPYTLSIQIHSKPTGQVALPEIRHWYAIALTAGPTAAAASSGRCLSMLGYRRQCRSLVASAPIGLSRNCRARAAITSSRSKTLSRSFGSLVQRPQAVRRSSKYGAAPAASATATSGSTRSAQRCAARRTGRAQSFSRQANAAKKKGDVGGPLI